MSNPEPQGTLPEVVQLLEDSHELKVRPNLATEILHDDPAAFFALMASIARQELHFDDERHWGGHVGDVPVTVSSFAPDFVEVTFACYSMEEASALVQAAAKAWIPDTES